MARRINIRDEDDTVVERDYRTDRNYEKEEQGSNWLPLLIVPLLLGGLLWGLQSFSQNSVDRNNPGGQEFGVGGAPVVTTSPRMETSSPTPMSSPTLSPTKSDDGTLMPLDEITPTEVMMER